MTFMVICFSIWGQRRRNRNKLDNK